MDESDIATAREEICRAEAMEYRKPVPKPCGWCHNCSESIGSGEVFCSKDCRDDYETRQSSKERGGLL